ncbi:MAG: IS1182 family transposase [Lachnospiraceae bacterium]|nr:IS1182 family transposase [Lachnospiraceae bacterium]
MPKLFKDYTPDQLQLPLSYEEIIPKDHLVRVVNTIVDELDLSALYDRYAGGGCPAYHPQMMLKIMIFAYSQKIYSSRQISKAIRENINFIWLAGGNRPDFRTINRFRSDMKDIIEDIFYEVVRLLINSGYIRMENYFLDGTKIEANANKYTFVWNKAVKGYDKKLDAKVREHLRQIDRIVAEENDIYLDEDLEELGETQSLTSQQLEGVIESIDEKLSSDPKNRQLKKTARVFKKDLLPRKKKYERSSEVFEGRSSYSKTDHDATFMRMKEDHMLNGQLKPGYNIQMGTENNFIVGFTIHPNPTDTKTMIPHLEHVKEKLGRLPENIVTDAGYGSEENYEYLEEQKVSAYVKYNKFHWEKKKKNRKDPFLTENLYFDPETDTYLCPAGKRLEHISRSRYQTDSGYETFRDIYQCETCDGCPYESNCKKSAGPRRIRVSHRLNELKKQANDLLCSEKGIDLRKRRVTEVEQTFGRLKGCWGFRRFLLRGKNKVKVEFGLLSIAHNITKIALMSQ